ncbi:Na+/H+ antiporter NhaA [Magnetospirillum sp. UT-4]|uniref:Na+/H+ antiporter NhaA n=1 Tax=Magnetospirillum sp. UT-4 TaxID=2681467 RepID=UPI0015733476|nr:Na+/H+ antiporter NhaA [Magnetospirillum sp. UT-4]
MPLADAMRAFVRQESASGIILMATMVLALAVANSPAAGWYERVLAAHVAVGVGTFAIDLSVLHWINDGLMAVFFLLVALEIKREMRGGELSRPAQVLLPATAAVGGMAVPALVYLAVVGFDPALARGWAIPSATDIAFSLGVLALLGTRVPAALKVFLAALAIIDDLGAIVVIALFYAGAPSWPALGAAALLAAILLGLNRMGVRALWPYLTIGLALWVCMEHSGVHATIAGVVLGLTIPADGDHSPLQRLEHALLPWVAFGIMPLFALANAGLSFAGLGMGLLVDPVFLGIALGLFLGKQIGVAGFAWGAIRLGVATLPDGVTWRHLYGVALLTGIGFTMSLFIGSLAFPEGTAVAETRAGVLAGSLAAALAGFVVLARARRPG